MRLINLRLAEGGFRIDYIRPGLGFIMLGMGLTLHVSDFQAALFQPRAVVIGVSLQFLVMPSAAWAIAKLFQLDAGLAIGLILVGCCPGGTASNVICYMARASVPLSVLMTLCSTTVAIFATPLLTRWLAGAWLPVDAMALFLSMIQVVLIPLIAGIAIRSLISRTRRAESTQKWIESIGPVAMIVLIVACIVGARRPELPNPPGHFSCQFSYSTHADFSSAISWRQCPAQRKPCVEPYPLRWECRIRALEQLWPKTTFPTWQSLRFLPLSRLSIIA